MDKPQARTKVGDVLFVRVGVGCIGRAAAVLHDDETGIADDYLYILRFRSDQMLPEVSALLTQTQFFKQQLERCKRGTGTVTVPQRLLREILVPVPPMSVQHPFAEAYRKIHYQYRSGLSEASELASLVSKLERVLMGCRVVVHCLQIALNATDRQSPGEAQKTTHCSPSGTIRA